MSQKPAEDVRAVASDASLPRSSLRPLALLLICVAQLMATLDVTIVNLSLPSVQSALDLSNAGLAWVIDAYTLSYAGLLLVGGRLGDLLGHRRTLMAGIALFTVSSAVAGLAQGPEALLAARAGQGLGAALATPTTLSLITTLVPAGPRRTRAMVVYGSMAGIGITLGLVLGGVLTEYASWRWVFLINLPIGATLLVAAPRLLPDTRGARRRLDLAGAVRRHRCPPLPGVRRDPGRQPRVGRRRLDGRVADCDRAGGDVRRRRALRGRADPATGSAGAPRPPGFLRDSRAPVRVALPLVLPAQPRAAAGARARPAGGRAHVPAGGHRCADLRDRCPEADVGDRATAPGARWHGSDHPRIRRSPAPRHGHPVRSGAAPVPDRARRGRRRHLRRHRRPVDDRRPRDRHRCRLRAAEHLSSRGRDGGRRRRRLAGRQQYRTRPRRREPTLTLDVVREALLRGSGTGFAVTAAIAAAAFLVALATAPRRTAGGAA